MCFHFTIFLCDDLENIYTLSYYHHQIGSMNYYPLFRVRSWNNGMCCMSFYILTIPVISHLRNDVWNHRHFCCFQLFVHEDNKANIHAPFYHYFVGRITGDQWIFRTKGQSHRKCFHVIMSPWYQESICFFFFSLLLYITRMAYSYNNCGTIMINALCLKQPIHTVNDRVVWDI